MAVAGSTYEIATWSNEQIRLRLLVAPLATPTEGDFARLAEVSTRSNYL
jgi:hypothetical protein